MIAPQTDASSQPAVWASNFEYEPGRTLVRYQAAEGQAAFALVKSDQVPEMGTDWDKPAQLIKSWQTGPFTRQQEVYDVKVETRINDGQKLVSLQDFDYDPIARRYILAIKSLKPQTVTDTLRVDALGPQNLVLKHEAVSVTLSAGQVLHYSVDVPAELGRPTGLRVTLDDPFDGIIQSIVAAAQTRYSAVRSGKGFFNHTVKFFAKALGITIVQYQAVSQADPVVGSGFPTAQPAPCSGPWPNGCQRPDGM